MSPEVGTVDGRVVDAPVRYVLAPNAALQRFVELKELNGHLTAEYVFKYTRIEDVTFHPALLDQSQRNVAEMYHRSLQPTCSPEEVYQSLLLDGKNANAMTLSAVMPLPRLEADGSLSPTDEELVISSMRFVHGDDYVQPGTFPIKEQYEIVANWNEVIGNYPPSTVTTVGRYAIMDVISQHLNLREQGVPGWLTGSLLYKGYELTKLRLPQTRQFLAVMSPVVVKHVEAGGVTVTKLDSQPYASPESYSDPLLKKVAVDANAMYDTFPRYWRRKISPFLYRFHFNEEVSKGSVPRRLS